MKRPVLAIATLAVWAAPALARAQTPRAVQKCYAQCRARTNPCANASGACAEPARSYDCSDREDYRRFRGYCDKQRQYARCARRCGRMARKIRAREARKQRAKEERFRKKLERAKRRRKRAMERIAREERRKEGFDKRVKKSSRRGGWCPWWRTPDKCETKCRGGDAETCTQIGLAHYWERASAGDEISSLEWSQQGCDLGSAYACKIAASGFAQKYMRQPRQRQEATTRMKAKAMTYGRAGCANGDGRSCWVVGEILERDSATGNRKAVPHFRKGCRLGSYRACKRLFFYASKHMAEENHVPQNMFELEVAYMKALDGACSGGDFVACESLVKHDGAADRDTIYGHVLSETNPVRRGQTLDRLCASGWPIVYYNPQTGMKVTRSQACRGR